jgi:type II secretory pathway pseudopilin PulG
MIIIGVLSGMLMVVSFGVTHKAEATKLVSNMENLRVGCIMYYSDTENWPSSLSDLEGKMDIQYSSAKWTSLGYSITDASSDLCCVLCDVTKISAPVKTHLKRMAPESGLMYSASMDIDVKPSTSFDGQATGYITMVVYNK